MHTSNLSLQLFQPAFVCSIDAAARQLGASRRAILLCCKYQLVKGRIDPLSGAWCFDRDALSQLRRIMLLREFCGGSFAAARMILALEEELRRAREELRLWRG